ncbi:arginine N-succinyltransferase [Marinobacter mobilis]|uniref:Arginine N-succinyltransferase n=1 Tax=Marinobacter mobilis TaxID=488533 RepID=A0A1H2WNQ2_9GAMM|nr:arginine N-succinyltransferase [Marinobacter mobilis]SDW82280.1 arginine N-succinyltransferase [Marinobacter mobilis]
MIIRPIAHQDLPALQAIAIESGPGFTSLIDDHEFLVNRIQHSIDSFACPVQSPGQQSYLFVLEDEASGEIMGTTGIEASVGLSSPLYHYHRSRVVHHSRELDLFNSVEVLNMCNHYTGCTEICTLYLRPRFRRAHAGKLLSKVRFLFMAQHPQRFADTVIAEMRGVSDGAGESPFWNWLQAHFVDLDFATVTQLSGAGNKGFIAELMPKYPLYTNLLSEPARAVIGQVHPDTRPALAMLEAEGFRHKGYVDLFDGGPTVEAERDQIHSIAGSVPCRIQAIARDTAVLNRAPASAQGDLLAIANTRCEGFRATLTRQAVYLPEHDVLQVPAALARSLNLDDSAQARFVRLAPAAIGRQSHTRTGPGQTRQPRQEFRYAL